MHRVLLKLPQNVCISNLFSGTWAAAKSPNQLHNTVRDRGCSGSLYAGGIVRRGRMSSGCRNAKWDGTGWSREVCERPCAVFRCSRKFVCRRCFYGRVRSGCRPPCPLERYAMVGTGNENLDNRPGDRCIQEDIYLPGILEAAHCGIAVLKIVQPAIQPAAVQQLFMSPLLDDPPLVQHEYAISFFNGREAVSYNDAGAAAH